MFLRCSSLFYFVFGELLELMSSCFNVLNVVSGFQFLLTSLKIAVVCSRLFYVFSEIS